jgi:hypothetical protein
MFKLYFLTYVAVASVTLNSQLILIIIFVYLKIKTRVQILKNYIKNSFYKGALVPYKTTLGTRTPNQPL